MRSSGSAFPRFGHARGGRRPRSVRARDRALRPNRHRRRHEDRRRHREGDRLRRRRGDARIAVRRSSRGSWPRLQLGHGGPLADAPARHADPDRRAPAARADPLRPGGDDPRHPEPRRRPAAVNGGTRRAHDPRDARRGDGHRAIDRHRGQALAARGQQQARTRRSDDQPHHRRRRRLPPTLRGDQCRDLPTLARRRRADGPCRLARAGTAQPRPGGEPHRPAWPRGRARACTPS